jgi:hypothetical protein
MPLSCQTATMVDLDLPILRQSLLAMTLPAKELALVNLFKKAGEGPVGNLGDVGGLSRRIYVITLEAFRCRASGAT